MSTVAVEGAASPKPDRSHPGTILVADDDAANRLILTRLLKRAGYRVLEAGDGRAALEIVEREEIDLALLDILMPRVDGMKALTALRRKRSAASLPVIMATAVDDREVVVRALKNGANDYVTKPFDREIVLARVAAQVELKRAVERAEQAHAAIRRDVQQAAAMQRARLPHADLSLPGCRAAWRYRPCEELAGDFLDVQRLDESRLSAYVMDVCGHGVPAALMTSAVSWALAKGAGEPGNEPLAGREPVEVIRALNERFREAADVGRWFTLAYATYDARTRELCYALAAHPRPILVRANSEAVELEGTGCAIGLFPPEDPICETYEQRTIRLDRGDRVYLFTDGLTEAGSATGRMLREEGALESLKSSRRASLDESLDAIVAEAADRSGERGFDDDVAILGLEIVD